jgi:hypothetical protein
MVLHIHILSVVVAAAAAIVLPAASVAQDQCASSAQQRTCSMQCCGRTSCAPACQADCVRACVDVCRAPQKQGAYQGQLAEMKQRCGYVGGAK